MITSFCTFWRLDVLSKRYDSISNSTGMSSSVLFSIISHGLVVVLRLASPCVPACTTVVSWNKSDDTCLHCCIPVSAHHASSDALLHPTCMHNSNIHHVHACDYSRISSTIRLPSTSHVHVHVLIALFFAPGSVF